MSGTRRTSLAAATAVAATAIAGALTVPATATGTSPTPLRAGDRTAGSVLSSMTLRQRVGQVFMVGTPATSGAPRPRWPQIGRYHVGNVMLTGRSYGGTRTPARVAAAMQARDHDRHRRACGCSSPPTRRAVWSRCSRARPLRDPSALTQGTLATRPACGRAGTWARQLRTAGVNMNLAPVLDTVPSATAARHNPPIGVLRPGVRLRPPRGGQPQHRVRTGMDTHGVIATVKHFPGLGRVHANPDTSRGVTDQVTAARRLLPRVVPTADHTAGAPVVMMSTAYYARLDAAEPGGVLVVRHRHVLRGDLGFRGVGHLRRPRQRPAGVARGAGVSGR